MEAGRYRHRPMEVEAAAWEPSMGAVHGVQRRPKKHEANPDEWFVRDRFGKETLLTGGEVVLTYPDGSHEALSLGKFEALYEPVAVASNLVRTDQDLEKVKELSESTS